MFEDCEIAKTRSSEEFTDEAINIIIMLEKGAEQISTASVFGYSEVYGHFYPKTPSGALRKKWRSY